MRRNQFVPVSFVRLLLTLLVPLAALLPCAPSAHAGTTVIKVMTQGRGEIVGTDQHPTSNLPAARGTFFWNGEKWVTNDTAAHMYYVDLRTNLRLKEYETRNVSGSAPLGVVESFSGVTVTRRTYTYSKRSAADDGTFRWEAVEYEVGDGSGRIAILRSRGTGNGLSNAYFDVYIQDPLPTTIAFLGDGKWFSFPALPREALDLGPDARYQMGALVGADRSRGLHWGDYFLDVQGGSDMGGYSYELECLPLAGRVDGLSRGHVTAFLPKWMNPTSHQLQQLRLTPSLVSETFLPDAGASTPLLVPVVLSMDGQQGSFFTTELTLSNRSATAASLALTYTASSGGGSGSATASLAARRQTTVPDAISWLRSLGVPIPASGRFLGTLRIDVSGPQPGEVAVTARTTTPVPEGRAGLAYPAVPETGLFDTAVTLTGLRSSATDRSNVAIVNGSTSKDARLRVVVTSWSAAVAAGSFETDPLGPGGFRQYTLEDLVSRAGLTLTDPNVTVRIEPLGSSAPFYAYGVVNDQGSSDGSFIFPVSDGSLYLNDALVLPVVVETASAAPFTTEVVLTNTSSEERGLDLAWVTTFGSAPGATVRDSVTLAPFQQRIVPSFVDDLRKRGIAGVGGVGPTYAGALFVRPTGIGSLDGVIVSGRTSAAGSVKGRYGLFQTALPRRDAVTTPAWIYGLVQDGTNRSNLAFVNAAQAGNAIRLRVELFRASDGVPVGTIEGTETTLAPGAWAQIDRVLERYAPGTTSAYARVTLVSGGSPFVAYSVVNDGGQPGQRSGDGAYVPMALE
jgi:hypothetical protein